MSSKAISLRSFAWTWLALLALAALSFGLSYLTLGAWEMPLAMIIAAAKAVVVALVFMELLEAHFVARVVVAIIALWLTLLISFMVLDVLTRFDTGVRPPLPFLTPGSYAP